MIRTDTIVVVAGLLLTVFLIGCSGVPPTNLGVRDGELAPCPSSPNCVSSQSIDREHFIAPLRYATSAPEAMAALRKTILGMKRAKIVEERGFYIHAEFTSLIWRFVDDVEFYLDDNSKVIHIRSASRLGKSDFGVNRKRIEKIRAAWERQEKQQ